MIYKRSYGKAYITVIITLNIKFMENISGLQPGDRVLVSFETEIICVRADGTVLVRMVGVPIEPHNLTLINGEDVRDSQL